MKIVIDAMCAEFGGIRTYVEQVLARWHELYPDDEVHVALRAGSTLPTPHLHRHEYPVPRPDVLGRPWAQSTAMHRDIERIAPDAVLATAPTTDVRRTSAPLAVVIHDLRSELRPEQFSRGRRLLRWLSYGRAYALASGFIAVSQRSLDDLHHLHPKTAARPGAVAYHGSDHVARWPRPTRDGPAIAFAHHTNKRPDLVVAGWKVLADRGVRIPLTFVGVSGALRDELAAAITELGLTDLIQLSPYLADGDFHAACSAASMIVFPSDFEGFGLPIVEGMAQGKPVVIGLDPACIEIAAGHAFLLADWTAEALADQVQAALAATDDDLEKARAWADEFQWSRTVAATRDALAAIT